MELTIKQIIYPLIIALFVILIISLLIKIVILSSTKYYFFNNHITSEFKLIIIKRHSVPYHQIVNIRTDISLWDRFCKAGDIVLHTAEDKDPDLVLNYIKDPEKIERAIYNMIYIKKIPRR